MHVAAESEVPPAVHEEVREAADRKVRRDRPRMQCHRLRQIRLDVLEVHLVGTARTAVVLPAGGTVSVARIPGKEHPKTFFTNPPPALSVGPASTEFHHVVRATTRGPEL